ncbi:MAG: CARDB domain-containing protein [Porphyromonadaceae bacterium]|nr:CARDB domain-containing protein [Porphyromonadaceae bacterium]
MSSVPAQAQVGGAIRGKYPALAPRDASRSTEDLGLDFVWDDGSSTKKGVTFFGSTFQDKSTIPSIVRFRPKKPTFIERLQPVVPKNDLKSVVLHCGTYTGEKYIGYIVNLYTALILPARFVEIDTHTGEVKTLRHLDSSTPEYQNWPVVYELTYDRARKECWGIARSKRDDKKAYSAIYSVNTQDGSLKFVKDLEFYVWGAACDYDGNLNVIVGKPNEAGEYIGSEIVKLDPSKEFAVIEGSRHEIKRGGQPIAPNYTHTADIDHSTGDLYWLASENSGYQYILKVAPETGESHSFGSVGFGEVVTGLYIPYEKADHRKAPARVQDLKASYKPGEETNAVLTWKNPTTSWDRTALSSITKVLIARDSRSNVVGQINNGTSLGASMTWTDREATSGIHTYYVIAENSFGRGVLDSIRCYTNLDVPGVVQNIQARRLGEGIELSWEAPKSGAHEGFIRSDEVSYTIVRMPGQKTIATDIKATKFVDKDLGAILAYSYIVIPKNAAGKGIPAQSNKVVAGKAYSTPYSTEFTSQDDADSWSALDANRDGKSFVYAGGGFPEFERMSLDPVGFGIPSDDWLFSPAITLKAGSTYQITVRTQLEIANTLHSFSINIGEEANPSKQTQLFKNEFYTAKLPQEEQTHVMTTRIEKDGTYNIGIHCVSIGGADVRDMFCVQAVSIRELHKKDLSVKDFEISELINEDENKVVVKVFNEGQEAQSNYTVKLLEPSGAKFSVVAETSSVPTVNPGESADCIVKYTPKGKEGKMMIAAEVTLAGDGDTTNDRSRAFEVTVLKAGTAPWSNLITGEPLSRETTLPMSFSRKYSVGQTTYPADELGFDDDATISRLAYEYIEGIGSSTEVNVKIYLGNVDDEELTGKTPAEACVNPEEMTLVYEGKVAIKDGAHRMEFNFHKLFEYKKGKHLCIQIWKDGQLPNGNVFPAQFATFGKGSGILRSMRYMSNSGELNVTNPSPKATLLLDWVPQVHLAVKLKGSSDNIQEVVVGANMTYNAITKKLELGGFSAKAVRVYDLSGRLVDQRNVTTSSREVALDLPNNTCYVVVAQGVDGSIARAKIYVNQ